MKKLLMVMVVVGVLFSLLGGAVMAAGGTGIRGVYYNGEVNNHSPSEFDGGDWAIRIDWTEHPDTVIKAEDFEFQRITGKWETTIAEVEARIQARLDDILIGSDLRSSYEEDDPVRQEPPVLMYYEELVTIQNKDYILRHRKFFKIHVYSQDPLRWITRFSKYPIEDNWWQ